MSSEKILVTRSSMPPYEEYVEMIKPLWQSHWLTNMGEFHQRLENELINYLHVPEISLMVNGHMTLELTIQSFEFPEGSEVITTPFTFISTTHAIVRNHLKPVFCDVKISDGTIDESKIEDLITDKTVAIVPVHVYGNVCNVEKIDEIAKKYHLKVIYDAAHAFGVQYKENGIGNYGDASIFSFHATKVFNTIEGGACCYSNPKIGKKLYNLKNFGICNSEEVEAVGANAKMNELQAAMGICNLKYIDDEIKKRRLVVEHYRHRLKGIKGIETWQQQEYVQHNYAYFPILVKDSYGLTRDELYDKLISYNIYPRKYFYPITNSFQCFDEKFDVNATPVALQMSKEVLTLPLYADLEEKVVDEICEIINQNGKNNGNE